MIDIRPATGDGILELHMSGRITAADYDDVITPALDDALARHDRIRLLARIGPEFEGYTAGAAWADTRLGLRHWSGFERVAVVTDVDWVKTAVDLIGFALPGPVRLFAPGEADEARRWLTQSLGSIHMTDLGGDALHVSLTGKLDGEAYERARQELDAYVHEHGGFRLLLDLREFDGWQGLAALGDHLKLVREHRHIPTRVAVVGNREWERLAEKVMGRFISAETRFFEAGDFDAARAWIG